MGKVTKYIWAIHRKLLLRTIKDLNKCRYSMCTDWKAQQYYDVIVSKPVYKFSAGSIQIPTVFLIKTDRSIINFIWKCKRPTDKNLHKWSEMLSCLWAKKSVATASWILVEDTIPDSDKEWPSTHSHSTPGYLSKKNENINVHSSFILNSPREETNHCPWIREWINRLWYIHIMENCSAIKINMWQHEWTSK